MIELYVEVNTQFTCSLLDASDTPYVFSIGDHALISKWTPQELRESDIMDYIDDIERFYFDINGSEREVSEIEDFQFVGIFLPYESSGSMIVDPGGPSESPGGY